MYLYREVFVMRGETNRSSLLLAVFLASLWVFCWLVSLAGVLFLLFCLLLLDAIIELNGHSRKYDNHADPLRWYQSVVEQEDGEQNREELPGCGDQCQYDWPKVRNSVEDKDLSQAPENRYHNHILEGKKMLGAELDEADQLILHYTPHQRQDCTVLGNVGHHIKGGASVLLFGYALLVCQLRSDFILCYFFASCIPPQTIGKNSRSRMEGGKWMQFAALIKAFWWGRGSRPLAQNEPAQALPATGGMNLCACG